jgi:hypothetical protein
LIVVGAVIVLGSGVLGFIWLNHMPELHPVPFGEHAAITATRSGAATIFTTAGQATVPSCLVTTEHGAALALGKPARFQQSEGLESTYGFTTTSGRTYTVSCSIPGEGGRFAVGEIDRFPEAVFLVVGSIGLLTCVGGGVLAWRERNAGAVHSV